MTGTSAMSGIIFMITTFFGLTFLFGTTTQLSGNTSTNIQSIMNYIFAPWPSAPNSPAFTNCNTFDFICNGSNLQAATAYIGYMIGYLSLLGYSFVSRISAFNLLFFALFGFTTNSYGIPFATFIFLGFAISVGIFFMILFRGSTTGA